MTHPFKPRLRDPAILPPVDPISPRPRIPMKKITPIVFVEAIEPVLPFWHERLGFETTVSVPEGDHLGFAILQKDGVELMYQTFESVDADIPALGEELRKAGPTTLFCEVEAIDPLLGPLEGVEVVVERRRTFYGMDELFVRAPCGTIVGLAARTED